MRKSTPDTQQESVAPRTPLHKTTRRDLQLLKHYQFRQRLLAKAQADPRPAQVGPPHHGGVDEQDVPGLRRAQPLARRQRVVSLRLGRLRL